MPPINFKLNRNGQIRLVIFPETPTWGELAHKLEALYGIAADNVGISYIDNDNDEITASSDGELQDYFQTTHQAGQPVKFKVLDLSAPHPDNDPGNTNPSGQGEMDSPESDWQALGSFNVAEFVQGLSDGPHAFVEILDSDVSGFAKERPDTTETASEDTQSTVQPPFVDKGKRKAPSSSLAAASVTSVIDEDFARKYPIHVVDHNSAKSPKAPSIPNIEAAMPSKNPFLDEGTPKPQGAKPLHNDEKPTAPQANEIEDPPLLPLETPTSSNASASLSHDIATLLTTFTGVISSHPELSEGIRNVVRNASSGAYWHAPRAALSQAANDLQQTGAQIEEEAARRVSEALGSIFRTLSLGEGTSANAPAPSTEIPSQQGANSQQSASIPSSNLRQTFGPWFQPTFNPRGSFARRSTTGLDGWNYFPNAPWASVMPNHPAGGSHIPPSVPLPPNAPFMHRAPFHPPPPPPPPVIPPPMFNVPFHRGFPPPLHHQPPPAPSSVVPVPIVPVVPSEPVTSGDPDQRSTLSPTAQRANMLASSPQAVTTDVHDTGDAVHSKDGNEVTFEIFSVDASGQPVASTSTNIPSKSDMKHNKHQELRDRVEEAKRQYKAQKEAYRKERETRKKERDNQLRAHAGTQERGNSLRDYARIRVPENDAERWNPANSTRDDTSSWVRYPQMELSSTPRRHHTHLGHGSSSRRSDKKPEDLTVRAQARIAKRLLDMGFSEHSHPELPEKIKKQMPSNRVLSKEEEDDIVTNLLEEILAQGSKSPVASGQNKEGAASFEL
ncbi:hypothetical protein CPC08DRAFT_681834 [Agrocybe pediades]|nr:hypothetical protein CPC08DRAFT_681834 [Agrocybe pediades]